MQGKTPEEAVSELLTTLDTPLDQELVEKYQLVLGEDDAKTLKKKFKKQIVEDNDSNERALEKVSKLMEELIRSYQAAGKQQFKTKQALVGLKSSEAEKEKALKNKAMFQNLFTGFKKKYDDEIQNASKVEKEEQDKRKQKIEELQERIQVIQKDYQQAGKIKVEKFKQNEMLKHELSKFQPHLLASESLADAQLKKKSIQIQIQMTTLKQKIEMMSSFKTMRVETESKMKSGRQLEQKVDKRLKVLNDKEEEHKISLAKAHLVFQDYKKAFNVLKTVLPQKQKDAYLAKQKVKKATKGLEEMKQKIDGLDKEIQTHTDQLQVLKKLEQQLQVQIKE